MVTFWNTDNGTEIKPIVIDQVTGTEIGTRAIHQLFYVVYLNNRSIILFSSAALHTSPNHYVKLT